MIGKVAESLHNGYKTSFILGYLDAIGTSLNSVDSHKLPKPTDPRDIAEDTVDMDVSESDDEKVNEGENLSSPYDEKINRCVQLAGELIDMARKDPQTFKSIVKTTLDKIDIDPSILSVMSGVKSKMDLFKAAISVAKNGKIKDILKSLYR